MDKNASGDIDFPEFVDGVVEYCLDHKRIFAEAAWKDPGFDDDPINADVIKNSSAISIELFVKNVIQAQGIFLKMESISMCNLFFYNRIVI